MPDIDQINRFLQDTLARGNRDSVAAVEAAAWLNGAGFLDDSPDRPGLPLRKLLRAGRIHGQVQESNGRWFIHRVSGPNADLEAPLAALSLPPRTTSSTAEDSRPTGSDDILPDILCDGLRIVFVGTAVGDTSARRQHYYSNPRNAFYRELHRAGLIPRLLAPEEDTTLPQYGLGLTDLVKSVHASDDTMLSGAVLSAGGTALKSKLERFRPTWVCFNGMNAYEAFAGHAGQFGEAKEEIEGCRVYVVPSTSGRVADTQVLRGKTRSEWFAELASRMLSTLVGRVEPAHVVVPGNAKGWSYRRLFGDYLIGARQITVRDPFVRQFFQNRNLMEFLRMIYELAPEGEQVDVLLVTKSDLESRVAQEETLNQIMTAFSGSRIAFTWEYDNNPDFHARSVSTDTGWKIALDRGLDIFKSFERGPFSLEQALQEARPTRGFEVTYLREEDQVR